MKMLVGSTAVILLLIIGGTIFFMTNINWIVKSALEKYGSKVTQTEVTVSGVDISLLTGKGSISGIRIGNPKAFIAARALDVGDISMEIDTATLTGSQPIIIKKIIITDPDIVYEVNATGDSNLNTIKRSVGGADSRKKEIDSDTPPRKVIIKDLYIRNGRVSATHSLLKGEEVTATLPEIHMRNIGQGDQGANTIDVAQKILNEVIRVSANAGASALQKELISLDDGKNILDKAGDGLKGAVESIFSR